MMDRIRREQLRSAKRESLDGPTSNRASSRSKSLARHKSAASMMISKQSEDEARSSVIKRQLGEQSALPLRRRLIKVGRACLFATLRPDSAARVLWDLVVLVCMAFSVVALPLAFAFADEIAPSTALDLLISNAAVDLLLLLDVIIQLRTAYFDEGVLVRALGAVAYHYVTQPGFVLDVVGAAPAALVQLLRHAAGAAAARTTAWSLLRFFRVLRLFELLKALRLPIVTDVLERHVRFNPGLLRLVRLTTCLGPCGQFHISSPPAPPNPRCVSSSSSSHWCTRWAASIGTLARWSKQTRASTAGPRRRTTARSPSGSSGRIPSTGRSGC